ncbi:MAG: Fe-S cluster assembly protein SufD [Candidatus Eisenbacteria bacterium]|nr:Fe-S cluster assembly protein SufD [Candidatus Latescibacterota bacterium]MBD3302898.1 Fe-S cluster assembly protein SufD [Candidatus Eisenbacteria bacterium]
MTTTTQKTGESGRTGEHELPEAARTGIGWLDEARETAWRLHRSLPLPDRATHLWRYTDPARFALPDGMVPRSGGDPVEIIVDDEARRAGVTAGPLLEAARTDDDGIRARLGALVPAEFGFPESLNAALWSSGSYVRIPKGVALDQPIRIRTTGPGEGTLQAMRTLVVVEEGASATVVEEARGGAERGDARLNEVTEVLVGPNASVRLVPVQHLERGVISHRTLRARLDRDARAQLVVASFGAGIYKADLGAVLSGDGSRSEIAGFSFTDRRQQVDHHTVQDHSGHHSTSDINFRVVLGGRARSAYTGLIRIAKDAPHCEAFQENRNLLLSDRAKAESIPELEILTDEVRCTHGATAGPIDPEQLFYLASRGMAPEEATRMIVSGFLEETLQAIPDEIAEPIRVEMHERMKGVAR